CPSAQTFSSALRRKSLIVVGPTGKPAAVSTSARRCAGRERSSRTSRYSSCSPSSRAAKGAWSFGGSAARSVTVRSHRAQRGGVGGHRHHVRVLGGHAALDGRGAHAEGDGG